MNRPLDDLWALLGGSPPPVHEAVAELASLERDLGRRLPAVMRDYYARERASDRLEMGAGGRAVCVSRLARPMRWGGLTVDLYPEGHVLLWEDEHGASTVAARLDGSDDPPVEIEVETMPRPVFEPYYARFSDYVTVTGALASTLFLPLSARVDAPPQACAFESLAEALDLAVRGAAPEHGDERFAFDPDLVIRRVVPPAAQARWTFWSDDAETLEAALERAASLGLPLSGVARATR